MSDPRGAATTGGASAKPTPANNTGGGSGSRDPGFKKGGTDNSAQEDVEAPLQHPGSENRGSGAAEPTFAFRKPGASNQPALDPIRKVLNPSGAE